VDMDIHGYIRGYIHGYYAAAPVIKQNTYMLLLFIIFYYLTFLLFIFSFIHSESNE